MILKEAELRNFRLHKNTTLNFSDNLNYIIGGNGQGKTSILEAVYYLCTTKNLNQASENEVITFDTDFFCVEGIFEELTKNNAKFIYELKSSKKNYSIDGKQVNKASSIIGKFPVVTLTPADHSITQGSPAERRRFIDLIISQSSLTYLKILLDYNKTLKNRAVLLNSLRENFSRQLADQLESWTVLLIKNGIEIIKHRHAFLTDYNDYIKDSYKNIMENEETPSLKYEPFENMDQDKIEEQFIEQLDIKRKDEIIRGVNLVGPHRDEFHFYINDFELKKFGSQGQHKTFQIALRFGQFFYLKNITGKKPIFLLDDVFGELDTNRILKISKFLKSVGQAIITMTDFANLEKLEYTSKDKIFNIKKGALCNV